MAAKVISLVLILIAQDAVSALNIYFEESDYSFPENAPGTIVVRKDSSNVAPVTVSISFLTYGEEGVLSKPASCPDPAEYELSPGGGRVDFNASSPVEITFAASDSSESIAVPVPIIDDEIFEADEGFFARLSISPTDTDQLEESIRDTTLICISNDDGVNFGFSINEFVVSESAGYVTGMVSVEILNDSETERELDLLIRSSPRTATENVDYVFSEMMLTLGPTVRSAGVNFTVIEDSIVEQHESFLMHLSLVPFSGLSLTSRVTITDNDVLEIGFPQAAYSVSEAAGLFTDVIISILRPLDPATQVDESIQIGVTVSVTNSLAIENQHFTAQWDPSALLVSGVQPAQPLHIDLLDDETPNLNRTFNLSLGLTKMALNLGVDISLVPQNTTTVTILDDDGCVAETTTLPALEEGGLEITLSWPETGLGETVTLQCQCGNLSSLDGATFNRTATRRCGGSVSEGTRWEPAEDAACNFSIGTRRLCQGANLMDEADEVLELLNVTTSEEAIGVDELEIITILLELLANVSGQDLTRSLLEVLDNLLFADVTTLQTSQAETNTSSRILALVDSVAQTVPIPENETSLVFSLKALAVAVTELDPDTFQGHSFTIDVDGYMEFNDRTTIGDDDISFEASREATASLSLPAELLRDETEPGTVLRITNTAYLTDALFTGREEISDFVVGGIIVSASLSTTSYSGEMEYVNVVNLDPPISLTFMKRPSLVENSTNVSCNFWDFFADDGYGDWSSSNCQVAEENDTSVVCECSHLTNFAILLDPNPVLSTNNIVVESTLSVISIIGVTISTICLIILILTYLSSKKLRNLEPARLFLNICFALLGIYILFIVSLFAVAHDVACAVVGGLLHYFFLVTFFLMAAEALDLYTKLVIVIGIPEFFRNRYVLKVALVSWILPFFIVVISEAPDWTNYTGEEFCRPYRLPFWIGLVVPFALIYIFNWVMFFVILVSLLRRKRPGREESKSSKLKLQFLIALKLSLLFGLGWGVGMVATASIPVIAISYILQAIFIVLTSFQGLMLFVMDGLLSADARNEWKRWISIVTCHRVSFEADKTMLGGVKMKATQDELHFSQDTMKSNRADTIMRAVRGLENTLTSASVASTTARGNRTVLSTSVGSQGPALRFNSESQDGDSVSELDMKVEDEEEEEELTKL